MPGYTNLNILLCTAELKRILNWCLDVFSSVWRDCLHRESMDFLSGSTYLRIFSEKKRWTLLWGQEVLLSSREEVRVGTSLRCGGSCRWGWGPALWITWRGWGEAVTRGGGLGWILDPRQGYNDLLLEGGPIYPFVVQEGSNFNWLWCKQLEKPSLHYEEEKK